MFMMTEEQREKLREKALEAMKRHKKKERAAKKKAKMEELGIKPPVKHRGPGRPKKKYHRVKKKHKCRRDAEGNWMPTRKQIKAREAYKRRGKRLAEKVRKEHIRKTWREKTREARIERGREKQRAIRRRMAEINARRKAKEKEKKRLKWEADAPKRAEKRRLKYNAYMRKRYRKLKNRERARQRFLGKPSYRRTYFVVCMAKNGHIARDKNFKQFKTREEAEEFLHRKLNAEKNVIFETKYTVASSHSPKTQPVTYEHLLCEKPWGKNLGKSYLKNEYGKYVEHIIEDEKDNMVLVEKYPARIEETVYVYGYDAWCDRKTFEWVFDNVLNEGFNGASDMKRIYQYRNKIMFCNDDNEIDLIILKNVSDAARFYNLLEERCTSGPYLFMGFFTSGNYLTPWIEERIQEKTGWTMKKIRKNEKS